MPGPITGPGITRNGRLAYPLPLLDNAIRIASK